MKENKDMARPSEYDFELCKSICDQIADGDNIKSILKQSGYPDWTTFRRWKNEHEELRTLYVSSQQDKGIALEDRLDELEQDLLSEKIDSRTYNVLVQTIKWKMAKFYPKVFGDKTILSGDEYNPLKIEQVTIFELPNNGRG